MKSFLLVDNFTGNTYTSVDGATWLTGNTPTLNDANGEILSITAGGNGFLIIYAQVYQDSQGYAYTSYDGLTWDVTPIALQHMYSGAFIPPWSNVIWDGTRYVVWDGYNEGTATSIDGKTWQYFPQAEYYPLPTSIYGVSHLLWNGTKYLTAGINVNTLGEIHNKTLSSTDAINWSLTDFPSTTLWGGTAIYATAVTETGKICIVPATTNVGKSRVSAISTDNGLTWTTGTIPLPNTSTIPPYWTQFDASFMSMAWNGSVFCVVGTCGLGYSTVATSPDGLTWTQRFISESSNSDWSEIAWNGSVFLILDISTSYFVTRTKAATSPDGITWTLVEAPPRRPSIDTYNTVPILTAGNLGTPPIVGSFWKDMVGTREFIY